MLFKKKLILLSLVLIFLGMIYVVSVFYSKEKTFSRQQEFTLAKTALNNAASILIGKTALIKNNDNWYIYDSDNLYKVDDKKVSNFLSALENIKKGRLVGNTNLSWTSFGVSNEQGLSVIVIDKDKKILVDFISGNTDVQNEGICVRLRTEDQVYSIDRSIASFIDKDRKKWLDLRLLQKEIKVEEIQGFSLNTSLNVLGTEVKRNMTSLKLLLSPEGSWQDQDKNMYTTKPVEKLLFAMVSLQAEDILSEDFKKGIGKAVITLDIGTGNKVILEIFESEDLKTYLIKESTQNYGFTCGAWGIQNILKLLLELEIE